MIAAGGALRGGRVIGNWSGLEEADHYDRRDLMAMFDGRALAARAMYENDTLSRSALEAKNLSGA